MATFIRLMGLKDEIAEETYRQIREAAERRVLEYNAVIKIQKWFRAVRVRLFLRHLNRCAVFVQKRWRGYLGRKYFRKFLRNKVFEMKLNNYSKHVIKIQKTWRGYYVRKYISNFYSRKRYLEGLAAKNEIVRSELQGFAEHQAQLQQWKGEETDKKAMEAYARKHHHLISTDAQPGIYNSPFQPYPNEMEFHLRNAKPLTPRKKVRDRKYDPGAASYNLPTLMPLPPIGPKPQGPFRDPAEVQKQRYRAFKPSLRVETSYNSLDEARKNMRQTEFITRLNDAVFYPFTKKPSSYESLLHTTSAFGSLPYGTKFFREEYVDKFLVPTNFRTLVPKIPIFEKLNATYSQGEV